MARCEDFPCCGHELGCCPDYDESGRQLNIRCVCGASLPVDSRFSICDGCFAQMGHDECDIDNSQGDYYDLDNDCYECDSGHNFFS